MFSRKLFNSISKAIARTPIFPLPILGNRPPVLLAFDQTSLGIEIAYEQHPKSNHAQVRSASRTSDDYCIPCTTPVLAVADGHVIYTVIENGVGAVAVDHGNRWMVIYIGFADLAVAATSRREPEVHVRAGDVLGHLSPAQSRDGPFYPLLFELWRLDEHSTYRQVDPLRFMRRWRRVNWTSNEHRQADHAA